MRVVEDRSTAAFRDSTAIIPVLLLASSTPVPVPSHLRARVQTQLWCLGGLLHLNAEGSRFTRLGFWFDPGDFGALVSMYTFICGVAGN
ncbi:hypothetical protein HPP92_002025 [Vanilla planifolia]|uniref:Uncharacterized protein n=1 Tax=Vanilla planifolia TaxID=51239 RepID=A0A835VM43_VANPL|nr:hypothetical protein HPP92_002025 [Vanilla planifolia]